MKPTVVGSACHRLYMVLDEALSTGVLQIPIELGAHAQSCPRCAGEVKRTESLLSRLRQAPAAMDLGPVPAVVDLVLTNIAEESGSGDVRGKRGSHGRWLMWQIASAAAVIFVSAGILTLTGMMIGEAVGGGDPSGVLTKLLQPFVDWTVALFGRSR